MYRKINLLPTEKGYLKVRTNKNTAIVKPRIVHAHNSYSCRLVIYISNIMDVITMETTCGYDIPEKTVTYDIGDLKIIKAVAFTFYGDKYAALLEESGQLWLALPSDSSRGLLWKLEGFSGISDINGCHYYDVLFFNSERKISYLKGSRNYGNPFSHNKIEKPETNFERKFFNLSPSLEFGFRQMITSEYTVIFLDLEGNLYRGKHTSINEGIIESLEKMEIPSSVAFAAGNHSRGLVITENGKFYKLGRGGKEIEEISLPFKNVKRLIHDVAGGSFYLIHEDGLHTSDTFYFTKAKNWKQVTLPENIKWC